MHVTFESPGLIQLRDALGRYHHRGVPHAARAALNAAAFEARREWIKQVGQAMTLRNTWTARSIRVEKARGIRLASLHATIGSVAPYMATQESGGTERKGGRHGVAIPTSVASGEGRGAQPRRKLVRRPNRLPRIQLGPRPRSLSRGQRIAVTIAMAKRSGRKFVFLDLERRAGLFRLMGGKRRPRLEMMHDLSRSSVRIPATNTLAKTLDAVQPRVATLAAQALLYQLARARVPGYVGPALPVLRTPR